ncbi:MAG TPA: hypothetical protein VGP63_26595 [Planctomycetaceae bacterium]|nr:hypothetical protein [Planctomycetaceae bacterium]
MATNKHNGNDNPSDEHPWIQRTIICAYRVAARRGLSVEQREQLIREALWILLNKEFDPITWPNSTFEDYRLRMARTVVQKTACAILRRRIRNREQNGIDIDRGGIDAEMFEASEVGIATEISDDLIRSVEAWIARRRKGWLEELRYARENGTWAQQHGHTRAARGWAKRAGLFQQLSSSKPSQIAIPVLAHVFEIPTAAIARIRGIGINAVHQATARFAKAVKKQTKIEAQVFASRGK